MRYKTTAICGHTWMPDAMAGKPHRFGVRDAIDRFSDPRRTTFRQALLSELNREGWRLPKPALQLRHRTTSRAQGGRISRTLSRPRIGATDTRPAGLR